jgi:large subunit ribosomal protein L3
MAEEPENLSEEAETEAETEAAQDSAAEEVAEVEAQEDSETEAELPPEAESKADLEEAPADTTDQGATPADEQAATEEPKDEEVEEADVEEPARIPNLKGLIGRKIGMTQIFDDTGAAIPVTIIEAGPCYITQIRTHAKDGYNAVQLGLEETSQRRLTGGQLGHLKRTDAPPLRHLREIRLRNLGDLKEGEQVTVRVFEVGDRVDVVGTSKGRGFAGAIKRHGFHRGPKTHGQSDRERAPGSHGATSTPGRVFKGARGPGHMGSVRVSSQNLRVDLVDPERNLLGVRGSVPGPKGGLVLVKEGRKQ